MELIEHVCYGRTRARKFLLIPTSSLPFQPSLRRLDATTRHQFNPSRDALEVAASTEAFSLFQPHTSQQRYSRRDWRPSRIASHAVLQRPKPRPERTAHGKIIHGHRDIGLIPIDLVGRPERDVGGDGTAFGVPRRHHVARLLLVPLRKSAGVFDYVFLDARTETADEALAIPVVEVLEVDFAACGIFGFSEGVKADGPVTVIGGGVIYSDQEE